MKKLILISILIVFASSLLSFWVWWQIPTDKEIRSCLTTKMNQVKLCPGSKDYVPLGAISRHLQRAIVISEDSTFWNHKGFDWDEIQKSARENLSQGGYRRGGSTITQQLAKNLFLTKDKTLTRKLLEALIASRIEKNLKKKEILERYLNVIEFGPQIFGVKAASSFYFKKSPAELDAVESAFLTMLLPNPKKYARSFHQKTLTPFARKRISKILRDLHKTGHLSAEDHLDALTKMTWFLGGEPPVEQSGTPTEQEGPSPDENETQEPSEGDLEFEEEGST